ncbi:voltage-gated chloride channel family protein [soil metagenome]
MNETRTTFRSALRATRWLPLALLVAAATGSATALFLWLLDAATHQRWEHPWLLYLLPLAGIGIALVYHEMGKSAERGSNLVIDHIHEPGGGLPKRMAPLILLSTVVTHLFGGSAGREGTAVQMGGSIASAIGHWLRIAKDDWRTLLLCGVAAGFGAVFGTPLAGAAFALEVAAIGRMRWGAVIPCLIASFAAHYVCIGCGIHHTQYAVETPPVYLGADAFILLAKIAGASILFGFAGVLFAELAHNIQRASRRYVPQYWLRPVIGAVVVIALAFILRTDDYLGLGVTTKTGAGVSIVNAFHAGGATPWSWLWKIIFTAVTLGCGFKGGEVTPLFFIGATLGNTLAVMLGAPIDLMAALGFIAVFAGATKTPIACTLMGIELFGAAHAPHFALACTIAFFASGSRGIYTSQKKRGVVLQGVKE